MAEGLGKESVVGVSWKLIETIIGYFFRISMAIVLARLLEPDDYSLLGIALIFFAIAEVFITSGLGQAYIFKSDATDEDAETIFTVNLILSLLFFSILWFSAPYISSFFNRIELVTVVRIMSFVVILNAMNVVQVAMIRKQLNFKKITLINLISSLAGGLLGIGLAFSGFGYWSLVGQQLFGKLLATFLYMNLSEWRIRLGFSMSSFSSLFGYSSWLLLNNLVLKFFDNMYKGVIGKFYAPDQLGLFEKGNQFPAIVYQQLWWSVGSVAFPVYVKSKNDKEVLERTFANFVKYYFVFAIPLLCMMYFSANSFVMLFLTEKWLGSVVYMQLFSIIGLVYPFYSFINQYLQGIGKTKTVFYLMLGLNFLRILNVLLNYDRGIVDLLHMELLIVMIIVILSFVYLNLGLGFNVISFFKRCRVLLILLIFCILSLSLMVDFVSNWSYGLQIVSYVLVCVLLFGFVILVFEKSIFMNLLKVFRKSS